MKHFITSLFSFGLVLWSYTTFGQNINEVNPNITPEQAVQNVLLGAGVEAFNITFNGSAASANNTQQAVRQFSYSGTDFPISSGVIMKTQNAPSVNMDPDLDAIAGSNNPTNGVVLEFDFIPSGDTLSFNYIFASTEYTSFTCSQFNDVFGFFISGPGINGPYQNNAVNLATIPGSNTAVGINTVNSGTPSGSYSLSTCLAANPNVVEDAIYFTTSYNTLFSSSSGAVGGSYNGATVLLAANSDLTCGDTFHIKLAISNVSDQGLNSAVFLQANSFSSNVVGIDVQADIATQASNVPDSVLIEGCSEASICFYRPAVQVNDTMAVHFNLSGLAQSGVDYPEIAAGDSVVFYPGEDTICLTFTPIQDDVFEGLENVVITAHTISPCGDTLYAVGEFWIDDGPNTEVISSDTTVLCANDSVPLWATTSGGFEPYTYSWSNGAVGDSGYVSVLENGSYDFVVTSTDACGFEFSDTSTVVLNQTLFIDTILQQAAHCGMTDGWVSAVSSGYTGTPNYLWSGPGSDPGAPSVTANVYQNLASGWYYFTVSDDVCTVSDSVFLDESDPPSASFTANPNSGASPLNVTFDNTSDSGTGYTYEWDFGNGTSNNVSDLSDQYATYIDEGSYTVTLIVNDGFCTGQASEIVTVYLPVIYDTPNVFTPNGDGVNDHFSLNVENVKEIELVVLNRWGNVVFETTDPTEEWNGKVKNSGADCADGTYFYKATLKGGGAQNEEVELHGFVQLFRGK